MAKTRAVVFRVRLTTKTHGILPGDLPGFLDMLRYEQGTVQAWSSTDDGVTVDVRVEPDYRHQPDRWLSFGIKPDYNVPQPYANGLSKAELELLQSRVMGR